MSAAVLVREAREHAGLSRSALAAKAGVPTSTVSRIEDGSSDPTLTMLARLIAAAGKHLSVSVTARQPTSPAIELLAGAYRPDARDRPVDWTRLRGFLDQLTAHPELSADAIEAPPSRTGDAAFDALLAGIAEKVADDAGIPRPRWTKSVPPSPTPWTAPGTPARTKRARAAAPPQLAARNIWLAAKDLWRNAE
ncbi:helix-turn-helix domain-containing protein [Kribbella catacumbae]|uniref:helix-turn-helix domain-containing protein n=1 Tax=Kribbella catacumbae TaxID=460086 RepID=UPI0003A5D12A|nr:helix-turn-helix transcriptional regulator [Kribbella catacumbae]